MGISLGIYMVAGANSCNGHPANTHYIYFMTAEEFHSTLKQNEPPDGLDSLLLALWYDAKGDWEKSHAIVQDMDTKEAALIHAYLHRKKGDDWNADYWYQRAGTKRTNHSKEEEWDSLVERFTSYTHTSQ